ncbi:MAG: cobyric acid synthase [Smithellaceae bacterium]
MTDNHGGNILKLALAAGRPEQDILDFSANINPLGPPDWLRPLISSRISSLVHYPDPYCTGLIDAFAGSFNIKPAEVIAGNGSTEILYLLPRVLRASRALIPVPSYADYATAAELCGMQVEKMPLKEEEAFALNIPQLASRLQGNELVIIGQPNNPTGFFCNHNELRKLAQSNPDTAFIVDEAFISFIEGAESLIKNRPANVVVLFSLTKFYAIPGLRLGCVVADLGIIEQLKRVIPPWSVNTIAQAVGTAALKDTAYAVESKKLVSQEREWLQKELGNLPGLKVYPGSANFLLVRINRDIQNALQLARQLLRDGIAIRVCDNFAGLNEQFFRVAVRQRDENIRLCDALRNSLGIPAKVAVKQKARAIMIQGTGSNAGKSTIVAALCRIMLQDGLRVAPFKAQNMSLNSCVTRNGGEMGRAQVVQAQAAKIDPDVRMNPVLLKPNSDMGSQIIIRGKPVGNMDFQDYIDCKSLPFTAAKEDFESLAAEYDAVIMEGAGSPAEINLKKNDIVNMNMALYARAPVLLVGDIDRGGVYASFIGTMEVLTEAERNLVAGFIINRFRGRKKLLEDAHRYILQYTGRKVLGVVPYLKDLGLPEEDSVSFKEGLINNNGKPSGDHVVVAVIDLPHISNFTDFDALHIEPDVCLRIVRNPADLGEPDAVILPGSKNVMGDLAFLKDTGMDQRILALAAGRKTEIIGICGGFQMLGSQIDDPCGIESAEKSTLSALGLLSVATHLSPDKTLRRVQAKHLLSGLKLSGYEIHHGLTAGNNLLPLAQGADGKTIGFGTDDGGVWGTYLHGVFDADEFRRWFIDRLRVKRGLRAVGKICAVYDLEPAFERLAAVVRESIDLAAIYKIMGLR